LKFFSKSFLFILSRESRMVLLAFQNHFNIYMKKFFEKQESGNYQSIR